MKKSYIAILAVFILLFPATIYFGGMIPGRGYYITGVLMILELMVPFFMAFEKRRPQARELVVIAVMCALAVIGRVAIPFPNFKAAYAVIMLAGIGLGPEAGYIVGAVTAFASNFFFGQGSFLPWQMMAYGAGGMLAGFVFRKGAAARKAWIIAAFGFLAVIFWIGPLLDSSFLFFAAAEMTPASVIAVFVSGFAVNVSQAASTALFMLIFGVPLLEKLERIKIKYGMMEG